METFSEPKTSQPLNNKRSLNNRGRNITNSLIRYFFIVCQINEHNKCLLSSNYSSEKRYKEKRMGRSEGTTTKAILLGTTSRVGAYIKVIVIRQTEYKESPEELRDSCRRAGSTYYPADWGNRHWYSPTCSNEKRHISLYEIKHLFPERKQYIPVKYRSHCYLHSASTMLSLLFP